MLSDEVPPKARSPGRLRTTSSEERRSPYWAPKPPAASEKSLTVSGLKALTSPKSR